MKFILPAVLLLLEPPARTSAAISARANKAEFSALCELVELCRSEIAVPEMAEDPQITINHILDYNMTTSGNNWRQLFRDKSGADKYHDTKPETLTAPGDWDAAWKAWVESAKKADKPDQHTHLKEAKLHTLDEATRKNAHFLIRTIAATATALADDIKEDAATTTALKKDEITKVLKEALYGKDGLRDASATAQAAFGKPTPPTTADCQTGTGAPGPISLYATIACLCGHKQSGGEANLCTDQQQGGSNDWPGGTDQLADSKMKALADMCPKGSRKQLTAAGLQAAINNVKKLITIKNDDGFLGAVVTNCQGTTDAGACVKYPNYKTQPGELQKVKWLEKLEGLNAALAVREQLIARGKIVVSILKAAEQRAKSLGTYPPPALAARQLNSPESPNIETIQKKKECEAHKNNKTACTDAKCIWKGGESEEKGECKAKEGSEQTSAQPGEATSKCTGQDTKEKCEGVQGTAPAGKKSVCGWIEDKCQDSSFLLNKQFALSMVSAAFAALLF